MQTVKIIIAILVPYFLGGLSVSILLSRKMYGKDVRSCGSGNAGATNMARVFGLKMGIVTLLFDVLKAVASIILGNLMLGDSIEVSGELEISNVYLPDSDSAAASYKFTDMYNQSYWTPVIPQ